MTKSTPTQPQTSPGNSQSKTSSGSPGTNKNSLFSFFSTKKTAKLSRNGKDQTLNNGIVVAAMPGLMLASGVPMVMPSLTPVLAIQATSISPDIFPANVSRRESGILPPKIGNRIEDTSQLALCASLLVKTVGAVPPPPPPLPSNNNPAWNTLSPVQLQWIQGMDSRPVEKKHLHQLMARMVDKFISLESMSTEAIHEIVLLGPVLDEDLYLSLLRCFLTEIDNAPTLRIGLLQGLVQLVQDAPLGYLRSDEMIQILRIIRKRLQDKGQKDEQYSIHLTTAVSKVLDVMASQKVHGLDRVHEHQPLLDVLSGLKTSKDPFLRYQALHAFQALQWVPNDETPLQCSLRHFAGLADGVMKISGAVQMNFTGFLGGLKDIQSTVAEVYGFVKSGLEDVPALIEDGRGIFDSVKEGLGSGQKALWYITLRSAHDLVRKGQLKDLNKLVCEAPSHQGYLFQWGVCQLLGEIAVDSTWDETTRGQAIKFLGELYEVNADSTKNQNIRRWVLTVLACISELPVINPFSHTDDETIRTQARTLVQDLERRGETAFPYPYLLGTRLSLPGSSSLLKKVNETPDVEVELHLGRLQNERMEGYNDQAIFISPLSKVNLQASDNKLEPLEQRVTSFLESENSQVMLILGDSGAGKSTFNLRLERDIWAKYEPGGWIPLFIDLKTVDKPDKDLVQRHLKHLQLFSQGEIDELRKSRRFILICDGYDERRTWSNLHTNNKLSRQRHWNAKMVISCRSQYLIPTYRDHLEPEFEGNWTTTLDISELYEEAVIVPFEDYQIRAYIDQYRLAQRTQKLFGNQQVWTTEEYMGHLTYLMEHVKNPFLLVLVLDILPGMAALNHDFSAIRMTRVEVYDEFVMQNFRNEQRRLSKQRGTMNVTEQEVFQSIERDFVFRGIDFSKDLSEKIFSEEKGVNSVSYSTRDARGWKAEFFGPGAEAVLLRESSRWVCQESSQGSGRSVRYRFTHGSMLEYFYSRLVYDPSCDPPYQTLSACLVSATSPSPLVSHPLNQRNLVAEPLILDFLAERAQQSKEFKDQLHSIVQLSKTDHDVSQAATNAMTILVQAGVQFSGQDLRGIQVPGADLSFGIFDSAQLQGADLRKTRLQGAWLRDANLSEAHMDEAVFGEWPALSDEKMGGVFAYSPDGSMFLAGNERGSIQLYNTSMWFPFASLKGHDFVGHRKFSPWLNLVGHLKFSPDRSISMAASVGDNTVRLWDLTTSRCLGTMETEYHQGIVTGLAFSLCGKQLALCFSSGKVQLWAVHTSIRELTFWVPDEWEDMDPGILDDLDEYIRSFEGPPSPWRTARGLSDVVYSPDGNLLATCFLHQSLRLWSLKTGECSLILKDPKQAVNGMTFSRDGKQILSSGFKGSIIAWDTTTGARLWIWKTEVERSIWSMTLSPNGEQVACAGEDGMAILLNLATRPIGRHNLRGHIGNVYDIVYSSNGFQIATAGEDKTVRLWDATRGTPGPIFKGHSEAVEKVIFSPDGLQIASGGQDSAIRLWDTQAPTILHQLYPSSSRHGYPIHEVLCTPGGQYIVSLSNELVCVWELQTGRICHTLEAEEFCMFCTMYASPCGKEIAVVVREDTYSTYFYLRLWDVQTGLSSVALSMSPSDSEQDQVVRGNDVYYLADGVRMACLDLLCVNIWNRRTGEIEKMLPARNDSVVLSLLLISPNKSNQLAMIDSEGVISLWDTGNYQLQHRKIKIHMTSTTIAYSPDGSLVLVYSQGTSMIQSWDAVTGDCIKTTKIDPVFPKTVSQDGSILVATFSQDRSKLVAYDRLDKGGIIGKVIDVMTGRLLWIFGDAAKEMLVDVSADGHMLAICLDGNVQVWNLSDGCQLAEIENLMGFTAIKSICWDKTTRSSVTTSAIQECEGGRREGLVLAVGHANGDLSVWKLIQSNGSKFELSSSSLINESSSKKAEEDRAEAAQETTRSTRKEELAGHSRKQKEQNKLEEQGERTKHRLVLGWTSAFGKLNAQGALIQNVKGLNTTNARLLKQNGARGKPVMPLGFQQAVNKNMQANSVLSSFKGQAS